MCALTLPQTYRCTHTRAICFSRVLYLLITVRVTYLPNWNYHKLKYLLPKSLWDDIQPIDLRETIASNPEPTKDPIPEKKKKSPMMALCMDLGAAE